MDKIFRFVAVTLLVLVSLLIVTVVATGLNNAFAGSCKTYGDITKCTDDQGNSSQSTAGDNVTMPNGDVYKDKGNNNYN